MATDSCLAGGSAVRFTVAAAGRAAPAPERGAGARGSAGKILSCGTDSPAKGEGPRGQVHTGSNMCSQRWLKQTFRNHKFWAAIVLKPSRRSPEAPQASLCTLSLPGGCQGTVSLPSEPWALRKPDLLKGPLATAGVCCFWPYYLLSWIFQTDSNMFGSLNSVFLKCRFCFQVLPSDEPGEVQGWCHHSGNREQNHSRNWRSADEGGWFVHICAVLWSVQRAFCFFYLKKRLHEFAFYPCAGITLIFVSF